MHIQWHKSTIPPTKPTQPNHYNKGQNMDRALNPCLARILATPLASLPMTQNHMHRRRQGFNLIKIEQIFP